MLWFSYAFKSLFKVCVLDLSPVIVVGAVIMHKMFDTGTKHLFATGSQVKIFQGPCG